VRQQFKFHLVSLAAKRQPVRGQKKDRDKREKSKWANDTKKEMYKKKLHVP